MLSFYIAIWLLLSSNRFKYRLDFYWAPDFVNQWRFRKFTRVYCISHTKKLSCNLVACMDLSTGLDRLSVSHMPTENPP